jgi:hypothetical protein
MKPSEPRYHCLRNGLVRLGDSAGCRVGQGAGATAQAHFQAHWQHRKCEVFPDAVRFAHPFDVEIPVEHRKQQLHLEQG